MTTEPSHNSVYPGPSHSAGPLRIVVADDHPLFRRAVVHALEAEPLSFLVVGEAHDGDEALALIEALEPNVALIDMRMPTLDGIAVTRAVAEHDCPLPTKLLLLSAFDDPELVWEAVSAGAAGYLDKAATHQEIREAVIRVSTGGLAFTASTAEGVNRGLAGAFRRQAHEVVGRVDVER